MVELGAGVGLEERLEAGVHLGPGRCLLGSVLHVGNRLAALKKVAQGHKFSAFNGSLDLRL